MISYNKIHILITNEMLRDSLSLRAMSGRCGIDYGTLWRLLKAKNNQDLFKDGKGRKGKIIMNLTADTLDKICKHFKKQPSSLISFEER